MIMSLLVLTPFAAEAAKVAGIFYGACLLEIREAGFSDGVAAIGNGVDTSDLWAITDPNGVVTITSNDISVSVNMRTGALGSPEAGGISAQFKSFITKVDSSWEQLSDQKKGFLRRGLSSVSCATVPEVVQRAARLGITLPKLPDGIQGPQN
jgi:hypothetical protein